MAGIALIIEFEGFSAVPYYDVAGVPTIGYGTIKYASGRKVTMHDEPITKVDAKRELMSEVDEKCEKLRSELQNARLVLDQHEFDALCSFSYNLGSGPITRSDSTINRGIHSHNRDLICDGMMMYNKAKVRNKWGFRVLTEVRGLTRRRVAEVTMFKGDGDE